MGEPKMERNDEVLTLTELMEILKVTRKTLQAYIQKGKIKAFKIGNNWRVTRESLADFIERSTK
jgi:excisionase family DNA binding protein